MKNYEELKAMNEEQLSEYLESLEEDEQEKLLEDLLVELDNNEKYNSNIYEGSCCYFAIGNGKIWEISNDASCSPRGGWFPDIVSGLSQNEQDAVNKILEKYDTDSALTNLLDSIYEYFDDEFEDEEVLDSFEEDDDEESIKLYKKLAKEVKNAGDVFESVSDFARKLKKVDLDEGTLYYEWEGEWIDFLDNIYECGEERGYFEDDSVEEWIETLLNLDNLIVTAD